MYKALHPHVHTPHPTTSIHAEGARDFFGGDFKKAIDGKDYKKARASVVNPEKIGMDDLAWFF